MTANGHWRWTEIDPQGRTIHCHPGAWNHIVQHHGEMSRYEAAVRSTLRSPDRIYDDPYSTSQRRTSTTPGATVVCYLALGYTRGREAGNWLVVIVLWEHDLPGTETMGYVLTAYTTNRLLRRWVRWEGAS